jgi:hypothetical protein
VNAPILERRAPHCSYCGSTAHWPAYCDLHRPATMQHHTLLEAARAVLKVFAPECPRALAVVRDIDEALK